MITAGYPVWGYFTLQKKSVFINNCWLWRIIFHFTVMISNKSVISDFRLLEAQWKHAVVLWRLEGTSVSLYSVYPLLPKLSKIKFISFNFYFTQNTLVVVYGWYKKLCLVFRGNLLRLTESKKLCCCFFYGGCLSKI